MKSWKTTVAGIAAILGALGKAGAELASGGVAAVNFGTLITGISIGLGLLAAKDSNVTGGTKQQ